MITNKKIGALKRKPLERTIKVMPASHGQFECDVIQPIYGQKITFIKYNSETALIIDNRTMSKCQIYLFKMLYDRLAWPGPWAVAKDI